jgi:hypothetical protein
MSDKYAAIHAERARFPVRLMCAALGVSPSGYYAARQRVPSARAHGDARLRLVVRTVFRETRGRYGAPRIHDELTAAGERTSEKRVARLMREDGLVARRRRRFLATTDSDHAEPVAPNLLARDFSVGTRACDTAWVSDLTYVPTREGFLYLAVVLDWRAGASSAGPWATRSRPRSPWPRSEWRSGSGSRSARSFTIRTGDRNTRVERTVRYSPSTASA